MFEHLAMWTFPDAVRTENPRRMVDRLTRIFHTAPCEVNGGLIFVGIYVEARCEWVRGRQKSGFQ